MLHCIMFEQPVLALVSELRNRDKYPDVTLEDVTRKLYQKFDWLEKNLSREELADLRVSDFSTRRRLSFKAQREVVDIMRRDFPGQFIGTSNAHLAYEFDLPLIGTMAHQWLMVHQQLGRLRESQNAALENWVREYRGRLGIALTDCISTDFSSRISTCTSPSSTTACVRTPVIPSSGPTKSWRAISSWASTR